MWSFLHRKEQYLPDRIQPMRFDGDSKLLDSWVKKHAPVIVAYISDQISEFAKDCDKNGYVRTKLFNRKQRILSEMPVCAICEPIYEKISDCEVIYALKGTLETYFPFTNTRAPKGTGHCFAVHTATSTVIDFSFAQLVDTAMTLYPGDRVTMLQGAIPTFIYRPHQQLAVLRGNLDEINSTNVVWYGIHNKRV